jgi:acyl carrier protein
MGTISYGRVRELMAAVLEAHGGQLPAEDVTPLGDIGFRSLHFAELALRVEDEIGTELNFDAPRLRAIETVGDVLDLIQQLEAA